MGVAFGRVCMLLTVCVMSVISCFFSFKLLQSVHFILCPEYVSSWIERSNRVSMKRKRTSQRDSTTLSTNQRKIIQRRRLSRQRRLFPLLTNEVKRTMVSTFFSSVLFTLSLIMGVATEMSKLMVIGWQRIDNRDRNLENRAYQTVWPLRLLLSLLILPAYLSFLLVCYSRLIMLFDNTQYSINEWKRKLGYSIIIVIVVLSFTSILLNFSLNTVKIGSLILIIPAVLYPLMNVWIVWYLLHSTGLLIIEMGNVTLTINEINTCNNSSKMKKDGNHSPNGGIDIDNNENNRDLIELALRLSLITISSIISTFIVSLMFVISGFHRSILIVNIRDSLLMIDGLINSYGLFVSNKSNYHYYSVVFGSIHRWCFHKILMFIEHQKRRSTIDVNDNNAKHNPNQMKRDLSILHFPGLQQQYSVPSSLPSSDASTQTN